MDDKRELRTTAIRCAAEIDVQFLIGDVGLRRIPMSPPLAKGINRYGLSANPYLPKALDELQRPADADRLAHVEQLDDVRQYIARAAEAEEAAVVLINGGKGAGRTTVANHLLAHYRDCRGIAPERFVMPRIKLKTRDAYDIIRNWLRSLHMQLVELQVTPIPGIDDQLRTGDGLDEITYQTAAALLMDRLSQVLNGHDAGFGVCLENVETHEVAEAALSIFEDAETLVVLTMLDYPESRDAVRTRFLQHQPQGAAVRRPHYPVVDLASIDGERASALIEGRWRAVSKLASPFDRPCVVGAFNDRQRSAGRVLRLTYEALDYKVDAAGEGPLWPNAPDLAFQPEELRALVKRLDSWMREDGNG